MKFSDYIKDPTINNLIKLKKEQLLILETDLKATGDDGFGRKQRRIENMKEDLKRFENDAKEYITARNK